MPTNVFCDTPILGTVLRVIKLTECGAPVTGTGSAQIVMDGFVQVQNSPQYDTGDRKITRKANGLLCVNKKLPDEFTNMELTADFCVWHPGLIVNTIAARLLTGTQSPSGTGIAYGTCLTPAHWSLELWAGVEGAGACDSSGNTRYFYNAWPHITDGKLGDMTFGNDPTQLQIMGNTLPANTLWTAGNSWLGTGQIQSCDHYLYNLTTTTPPTSACVIADYP